ncbi:MAG: HAD-IA family hydrolase [Candidatus Bathyarchaeota archaeon]|nr:MAG: HAD-IA family hydrolase [Candidatus Bathyarchaeota archaeon]
MLLNGIAAVLFDLDDTLIDSVRGKSIAEKIIADILASYIHNLGIAVDKEILLCELLLIDQMMNRRRLYDRSIWWQSLVGRLNLKVALPRHLVIEMTKAYWSYFGTYSLPFPDTAITLDSLLMRGYRLGMVTDTDGTPGVKMHRISQLSFKRAFSTIVIAGEDTVKTKPSVFPFKLAASRLGLSCAECVFVGDKPFTDIRGAKKAGMKSILIRRGIWESEEQPDFTVSSLSELCRFL